MKYFSNISMCVILVAIGVFAGLYIQNTIFQNYSNITYNEFTDLLNSEKIKTVEIEKDRILVITEKTDKEKSNYKILSISAKEDVIDSLNEHPKINLYEAEETGIANYLIILPFLLLFAILGAITMGSRRGNIKETLFREKKFSLDSPLQQERLNSITWQHLMSGEPLKIVAAYGDLSLSEQDNYLLLLLKAIQSEDVEVRRNASFAVREIGDRRTVLTLCKMLQEDSDAHVRMNVAMTLGIIRDEVAIESLKSGATDPNPMVRCAIATALGSIGDEECLEILTTMLEEDESWRARRSAVMALMKIRNDSGLETLIKALGDKEAVVRSSAAIALGELGVHDAIGDLCKVLSEEKDPAVRKEIIGSLHAIGSYEIIPSMTRIILEDNDETVRIAAIKALELMEDDSITKTFCESLKKDKSPDVRLTAAEALSMRKNPLVIKTFEEARKDEDDLIREFIEDELNEVQS